MKAGDGEKERSAAEAETSDAPRVLTDVIRVGVFAKRLLLEGDHAELVVVCADKPVTSLFHRIARMLAVELAVTLLQGLLSSLKCVCVCVCVCVQLC